MDKCISNILRTVRRFLNSRMQIRKFKNLWWRIKPHVSKFSVIFIHTLFVVFNVLALSNHLVNRLPVLATRIFVSPLLSPCYLSKSFSRPEYLQSILLQKFGLIYRFHYTWLSFILRQVKSWTKYNCCAFYISFDVVNGYKNRYDGRVTVINAVVGAIQRRVLIVKVIDIYVNVRKRWKYALVEI